MKKGCLIALVSVGALFFLGIAGIFLLGMWAEKQPMQAGAKELLAVHSALTFYHDDAALGSDDQARAVSKQYSLAMRMAREAFFTGTDSKNMSFSKGEFITYCSLQLPHRCAIVVHVPQLRNYAPDAKLEMAQMAWRMAVGVLQDQKIEVQELAVGIRGSLDYGQILVGKPPAASANPNLGVKQRTIDSSVLYPFFVGATVPAKP